MRRSRTHLTGLHHRGQQAHVELRSGRTNVVLSAHQLDILSTGQVRAKRHCKHTDTVIHHDDGDDDQCCMYAVSAGLTGDVAVVVGAVVVLQEGHERVQEVMRTQEHQLLQHI